MVNLLIKAIFWIINKVANMFIAPIFTLISTIIPVGNTIVNTFTSITTLLTYALRSITFWLDLLLVPKWIFVAFISFGIGIFAFNFTIKSVGLGLAIYHYFKP